MKKRQKYSNSNKKYKNKKIRVKTIYKKVIQYENGDFFEVEKILNRLGPNDNPKYFVKWKGWGDETNTWEPAKNLKNVQHLVYQYEKEKDPEINLDFLNVHFEDTGTMEFESDPDGEFEKDIPEKIIRMYQDEDGVIWAEIQWLIRNQNGVRPNNTMVPRDSLKEKFIRLLIEYYEMKIRFLK